MDGEGWFVLSDPMERATVAKIAEKVYTGFLDWRQKTSTIDMWTSEVDQGLMEKVARSNESCFYLGVAYLWKT